MMNIDKFLNSETRNDYYISSAMKKTWSIQIEILEEVKRICDKYNISYFADSGTLLGAIRHDGFIPWDDDIDLGMTRENYDKFISVCQAELNDKFFLQNNDTEIKKFFRVHSQIRAYNTTMITKKDYKQTYNRGIFVDIFVYDKVPTNEVLDNKFRKSLKIRKKLIELKLDSNVDCSFIKNIVKKTIGNIGVLLLGGLEKAKKNYRKLLKKYQHLTDNYYYDIVGYNTANYKNNFRCDIFDELISHKFEYTTLMIPKSYDEYLKIMYGEYMKPVNAPTDHGDLFIDNSNDFRKYDEYDKKEFSGLFNKEIKNGSQN